MGFQENETENLTKFFNACKTNGWKLVGEFLGYKIITKDDEIALVTDYGKDFAAGPWKLSEAGPLMLTEASKHGGHTVTEEG